MSTIWSILTFLIGVVVMIFVVILGAITAVSAAGAVVVAFPLSFMISLFTGAEFIDVLAWTWSLLTVTAFAIIVTTASQR